jgi:hypothetical protein
LRDPILKILNTKKGWWSGSNGRVPALQVWDLEFKHQYSQKKQKEQEEEAMTDHFCHSLSFSDWYITQKITFIQSN